MTRDELKDAIMSHGSAKIIAEKMRDAAKEADLREMKESLKAIESLKDR